MYMHNIHVYLSIINYHIACTVVDVFVLTSHSLGMVKVQCLNLIKSGACTINVHVVLVEGGEMKGHDVNTLWVKTVTPHPLILEEKKGI